ncbi:MAG: beta-ketoacyl-[acyl-carrier-protein] synthase family protein [Alistipes sp.]|nr:beta-ketoacyl-[acyl-carrier-protein] synthase family protein [Candidatus Minthomonas equi]
MSGIISVTGMGVICAIGNDSQAVLHSLLNRKSGIGKMRHLHTVHDDLPVGEVCLSTEEMKDILGITGDAPLCRTSAMGAIAVKEALRQAKIHPAGKRVALISGTTVGVMDIAEESNSPHGNQCGKSTEEIAEYAGLKNAECCTVCTACSSALNAIMLGSDLLMRGEADIAIVGGSEPLTRFHLNGFNSLMILDRERCRPFDDTRAGLNLGEGAAFLVLQKDVENALAYIEGYANCCDAFHQTATSPNGDGAFYAMTGALRTAGLKASDIKYVNAHGTATPDNDASETAAFKRVFGDAIPEISSTKSYTGHTTSASGAIETVICILSMRNNFIPASIGWNNAMPDGIIPSSGVSGVNSDHIMCNAFGFGGNDSSLIIGKYPPASCSIPYEDKFPVKRVSTITIDSEERLGELKEFMSPMESRRLCKMMKACLLSAFLAMKEAGISRPDAIISATGGGMLEMSALFLDDIFTNAEEHLRPTIFMQSTHNTVGSAIAISTGCHGYNITYSQGQDSTTWAMRDARKLISTGEARTVLLCSFEETVRDGKTDSFKAECSIFSNENI